MTSPVNGGPNQSQAEFWEDVAGTWLASQRHVKQVGSRFGLLAIDRLGLEPRARVLDVGCGSGDTTLELARRVGADGRVLGIDIAPSMVAAAAAKASDAGIDNVDFSVADAQVTALGEGSFDSAFSQFGVMFFDDPGAAFANVRGCVEPNGAFAFACWQNLFSNEWMFLPGTAFLEVTGVTPSFPGPEEPGPFSLSEAERIEQLLMMAGFREVEVVSHESVVEIPEGDVDSWLRLAARVGPVRDFMNDADEPTRERIVAEVKAKLGERAEGALHLSAAAFVVHAVAGEGG